MKLKRLIFLILGFLCLGLGCVGVALPILPTVPFFLVTVFCFANSSQKLHDWFVSTKLYKKHLESFVKKKGMTVQTKVGVIIPVTLLMGFGFFMMMRANVVFPASSSPSSGSAISFILYLESKQSIKKHSEESI